MKKKIKKKKIIIITKKKMMIIIIEKLEVGQHIIKWKKRKMMEEGHLEDLDLKKIMKIKIR